MKNVTLTINPNAITNLVPPPVAQYQAPPMPIPPKTVSVSFSAQFDSEEEARLFTVFILSQFDMFNKE